MQAKVEILQNKINIIVVGAQEIARLQAARIAAICAPVDISVQKNIIVIEPHDGYSIPAFLQEIEAFNRAHSVEFAIHRLPEINPIPIISHTNKKRRDETLARHAFNRMQTHMYNNRQIIKNNRKHR